MTPNIMQQQHSTHLTNEGGITNIVTNGYSYVGKSDEVPMTRKIEGTFCIYVGSRWLDKH